MFPGFFLQNLERCAYLAGFRTFCLAPGRMRFGQSPGFFNQNGGFRGKEAAGNRFGVILGSQSKNFKIRSESKRKSTLKLTFQRALVYWLAGFTGGLPLFFLRFLPRRHQTVKVALVQAVLQNAVLFKLTFGKSFGDGGSHFAFNQDDGGLFVCTS